MSCPLWQNGSHGTIAMKQIWSKEDVHLDDDRLDDGSGIQHDTLSRWRSGVQIPSGSDVQYAL